MKKYANVEAYVKDHGFKMKDLTPDEVEEATREMEAVNDGLEVTDGMFSPLGSMRRRDSDKIFEGEGV